jgi:hypothetical protein
MRRVIIRGSLHLAEDNGFSSGGFIADSQITGQLAFVSQQQFLCRNIACAGGMTGGAWNIVLAGCSGGRAPSKNTIVIPDVPLVAPKPYIFVENGQWFIGVPNVRANLSGLADFGDITTISDFEIVTTNAEMANVISCGFNVVVAPGIYDMAAPLAIAPNTVVLGVGMATLRAGPAGAIVGLSATPPTGARVGGFLLEATSATKTYLLDWGRGASPRGARQDTAPSFLYDIYARVGGSADPATNPVAIPAMVHINIANTICDNFWLWVADHGVGIPNSATCGDWSSYWKNLQCPSCLVVDADNVKFYGLAAEHATGDDLVKWNGANGIVYFFQSEFPYHVPANYNKTAFRGSGANLTLLGAGAYSYFPCLPATTVPTGFILQPDAHVSACTVFLNGEGGVAMTATVGGAACGAAVTKALPGTPAWCLH